MAWIRSIPSPRRGRPVLEVRWTEAGARRSERVGTDRRLAEEVRADRERIEREAAGGEAVADGPALVDRFLSGLKMEGLRAGTLDYYRRHLTRWCAAHPGLPPTEWSRRLVDAYLAAHPGWAPRTRWMAVAALKRLRSWSKDAGIYLPDATAGLRLPTPRLKARAPLAPEQVDRLLAVAAGGKYEAPIALAAYAGLSSGDLRALTWAEVDLAGGWLTRPGGREKTGQPLRVPILPQLAAVLSRARPLHPDGLVCRALPRESSAHATLKRLYGRAGIAVKRGDGWHLLRHSFGTLLMRAGVPQAVIGRLLSHRPGSVVTALYQHPEDGDLVAAMESLRTHLAAARAKA